MKIVEQTPHRLRLEAEILATIVSLALLGMPNLLLGLGIILISSQLSTLKCQRVEPTQGSCQLVNSSLLGSNETKIPLNQLQSAKVDVSKDSDGDNIYRVVLLTNSGEIPITPGTSDAGEKQKNAARINAFIDNSEEISLHVQQDNHESVYLVGGIFVLVGGGLVFGSLLYREFIVSYTFDKALDLVRLKRQTLFHTKVTELSLREINQVDIKEKTDSDGDKTYSVWLNLKSGEHISLSLQGITDKQNNQKIAECIRQFLNSKA